MRLRCLRLRLCGADSAAAVWCNGTYIGYTEDTFTPAEFDMTAAVHPGENELTVQVYRFSSGSWLEDQDFWRMSGLFRSVELFTKPEIHLEDVSVKQDFAPDFSSANVTFDRKVSGAGTLSVAFNGETRTAEVGEPAEYDSGVVFGKGEADPDVEEDVRDVSFTFTVEHPALCARSILAQAEATSARQVILQAAETLRKNYQKELCLADLLAEAHMSKSYFLRLFRRYMGTTPYNYLVNFRITQAKELLVLTDHSVSEIAQEVGFGDASNFSTRFAKATGQSPLQYRKSALKPLEGAR